MNASRFQTAAWIFTCLAITFTGLATRLSPVEMQMAWPWHRTQTVLDTPGPLTNLVALGCCVLACLTLAIAFWKSNRTPAKRAWLELILFHPTVFGFIWLMMPTAGVRPQDWLGGIILFGVALWMGFAGNKTQRPAIVTNFRKSLRGVATGTIILTAVPVLVGIFSGARIEGKILFLSLLLYPIYAAVQLLVFLAIPAPRLKQMGLGNVAIRLCCSLLFALVHWPNPLVTSVTFIGMFFWSGSFLGCGFRTTNHRGNIAAIALSMGLVATSFSQLLPDTWTWHMRVGPGCISARAVQALAEIELPAGDQILPADFMETIYPGILGRPASVQELSAWSLAIKDAKRAIITWQFYISDEYKRKALQANSETSSGEVKNQWPEAPSPDQHWRQLSPDWQKRILTFASDKYWREHDSTLAGFVGGLYIDILHREGEISQWSWALTTDQRKRLAQVLLENRHRWSADKFENIEPDKLRLTH